MVGPTASGKSEVAMAIATGAGLEVLVADSMQVYRGMDIGTAKPTQAEQRVVPHSLIDLIDPHLDFSVAEYQRAAFATLDRIGREGTGALLVGGTGLYVQAVVDELELPGQFSDVRAELELNADTEGMHRRLAELDPTAAGRMESGNRRRVVRALEVTIGSGRPFSSFGPGIDAYPLTDWRLAGLELPDARLGTRISERVDAMFTAGLVAEVDRLSARAGGLSKTARQALGYKEILAHLDGGMSLDECRELIVSRTRRFSRRQRSWFRRDPRITWHRFEDNPLEVLPDAPRDWHLT
ncbi:MAG: tRNA (adenosine(37)-N6)-dimethylallyltransferase MiaA [Acidimicrobiales bacterium]